MHVTSSQPSQTPSQQMEQPAPKTASSGKNHYNRKPMSYGPCKYTCPECGGNHYASGCDLFKEKTLSQKKEFVQAHSLCYRCLKPGHSVNDCRNRYNCKHCDGRHHVLLHSEERSGSTPASSGAVLAVGASGSTHSFNTT